MSTDKPNINNSCDFIVGQFYDCCTDCWRYDECKECAESDERAMNRLFGKEKEDGR